MATKTSSEPTLATLLDKAQQLDQQAAEVKQRLEEVKREADSAATAAINGWNEVYKELQKLRDSGSPALMSSELARLFNGNLRR